MVGQLVDLAHFELEADAVFADLAREAPDDAGHLAKREAGFARLVREDGISGMTSNPAIFEKAISGGREYDEPLACLVRAGEDRPEEIYERPAS